ncbi:Cucumber peeling cupredoxin like [Actinidia chinensis var. chinensis]|uniref:Cucumber peeling cupredoxin like n=1 Tax=Actinidia chinensis var. chinensis TaxID=1590841 RepID=A0A2R6QFV2_ACTCC|nr:Cucumber peeling cupredoxin like [Actinidia chinensis var. chinensis]
MERLMSMLVVGVVAVVMVQCAAAQTVHVVGDNIGWTIPQNGAEGYTTWASNKTFMLGDILIFNFLTNAHDVVQVPKASFDTCSSDNAIGNPITTGPANITLTSAGDHYYICTFGTHCQAGQKLSITVSSTPGAAAPPTHTTPTTPATPSPTSSTTPEACPPEAPTPKADGPTATSRPEVVPSPPDSSSSAVFAGFSLTVLGFAMALFL